MIFPEYSEWIVYYEVDDNTGYIKSKKKGLTYIPVGGWLYGSAGVWYDDDTLSVRGNM